MRRDREVRYFVRFRGNISRYAGNRISDPCLIASQSIVEGLTPEELSFIETLKEVSAAQSFNAYLSLIS
jgi:hypothetical protein